MSEDNRYPGVTGQRYFSPQLYHPPTSDAFSMPLVPPVVGTETTQRKRPKYTRSKTGCLTCRVKKVKCDEAKPICMRCTHGARECLWPEGLPTRKRTGSKRDSIDERPSTSESITESSGVSESPSSSGREQTPPYGGLADFVSVLSRVSDSYESTYSMSPDHNALSPYPQQHSYSFPVTSASYCTGTTRYDHTYVNDPQPVLYAMSTTSIRQQPLPQASPTYCHSELDTHCYTHRVVQESMRIGQPSSPQQHPHHTFY